MNMVLYTLGFKARPADAPYAGGKLGRERP